MRPRQPHLRGDSGLRCLVLFCLCLLLVLALPVLYLLGRSATCQERHGEQELNERTPTYAKLSHSNHISDHEENQYDKPWAHLQVPEIRNLATIQKRRRILQWKNPLARKMNYTNDGSLKIMEEGNYFVYSQVTFRAHNHRKTKKCEQLVLSKTHQYPEPLTLLKGSITLEANQTDWKKTIYVGGVTRLHEGDLLMVCVNDPELVEHSGDGVTYFGAFLI